MLQCAAHALLLIPLQDLTDSDLDQKQEYEGEAEEDDDDFIDDESEEVGSDISSQVRGACAAVRNRRTWQDMQSTCPVCADLRAILCHILDLH